MMELLRYRDVTRVTHFRDLLEQAGIRTFIRNENLSTSEGVSRLSDKQEITKTILPTTQPMLIWSGYGILVAPIVFISVIASIIIAPMFFDDPEYLSNNPWPGGVALLVAGVLCWYLGGWLRNRHNRTLFDRSTGEEVILRPGTSFFFIPMRAWGPILGLVGLFLISGNIIERMSTETPSQPQNVEPGNSTPAKNKNAAEHGSRGNGG
jgi:hypothetical protein